MKPYDSRTYFEKICLRLQINFDDYAEAHCSHAGHLPTTPSFANPVGTKYFSLLESMLIAPLADLPRSYKQQFVWSGMCEKTSNGYVLTSLGKKYVDRVHYEVENWGSCAA